MSDTSAPAVIEAGHYEETRRRLTSDPIIRQMAGDLHRGIQAGALTRASLVLTVSSGWAPRFEFTQRANGRYRQLGGTDGGHIGAVPEATIRVLDELLAETER